MNRFKHKTVLITGAAHGIGLKTAEMFSEEGARVIGVDIKPGCTYQTDISKKEQLEALADSVVKEYSHIDYLIHNAAPFNAGIHTCSYEQFEYALKVGVTAPFYLSKLLLPYFNEGGSIVNISSTRAYQSEAETESYSASKGAISALTHAMAVSLAGKVRVNSISPGWIETNGKQYAGPDADQHLVKRVGKPEDIAGAILFLCSDEAGFIDGENIVIDGGMSHTMIYHGDNGWIFEK